MGTAFITDGILRKSLSATRSLGSKGIRTVVGEKTHLNPSGFSKYCNKRVVYPDPVNSSKAYISWLIKTLEKECDPVLLPMDDRILEEVIQNKKDIEKVCKCILPSKEAYKITSDKYETMKLAEQQGIQIPLTFLPKDHEELIEIANTIKYPAIIKPRKSSGSRGIRKVETELELVKVYKEIQQEYKSPIIQEFIQLGERVDVCLLYDKSSNIKASFVQKEVRHFPIKMGPSTVQESVQYETLLNQSIKLLEPLKWTGIVEIEFMVDPRTGQPKLMEINPRFWNSLDLAVQSGVDFPFLYYKLSLDEEIPSVHDYKVGIKSRWLFPGDILHFLFNPKRWEMNPPLFSGKKSQVYDDTFRIKDLMPALILIVACLRYAFSFKSLKLFFKR